MSDRVEFAATESITVRAPKGDIWAVWVDVTGWQYWNPTVESSRPNGNFRAGNTFDLTTTTGLRGVATITSVAQGEGFSDELVAPFGVVRRHHHMEQVGEDVTITHRLEAEVDPSALAEFEATVWPAWESELAESLTELADLVTSV